jgi:hypothetical protein
MSGLAAERQIMMDKQIGPVQAQPNILRDQRVPNTFKGSTAPGSPASTRDLNSGGGNRAPSRRVPLPAQTLWVYVAVAVVAVLLALFLLFAVR